MIHLIYMEWIKNLFNKINKHQTAAKTQQNLQLVAMKNTEY